MKVYIFNAAWKLVIGTEAESLESGWMLSSRNNARLRRDYRHKAAGRWNYAAFVSDSRNHHAGEVVLPVERATVIAA